MLTWNFDLTWDCNTNFMFTWNFETTRFHVNKTISCKHLIEFAYIEFEQNYFMLTKYVDKIISCNKIQENPRTLTLNPNRRTPVNMKVIPTLFLFHWSSSTRGLLFIEQGQIRVWLGLNPYQTLWNWEIDLVQVWFTTWTPIRTNSHSDLIFMNTKRSSDRSRSVD